MKRLLRRPAVAVATAALVAVGLAAVPATAAQAAPTDIVFSEYVEGSSNNKALELYNPTANPIDLDAGDYFIRMFSNGNTTSGVNIALTGTIPSGEVYVVAHGSANATILAQADQTNSAGWFNGNDAVTLTKGATPATVVDSIGQVGFDPGSQWGTGLISTADNTLRRIADSCEGDTNPGDTFDPSVVWEGFAVDTFDGLGTHVSTCGAQPEPLPEADCSADIVTIGSVQGSGTSTPVAGQVVRVEGVVVGDFQEPGGLGGFFIQDEGDGDPATSDGIFVLSSEPVDIGDAVHVVGTAGENFSATRIAAIDAAVCDDEEIAFPEAAELALPIDPVTFESLEGMYVTMPQPLTILEYFEFDRFGEIVLGTERQIQPTAVFDPGSPEAVALAAENAANRITLDDGRNVSNPDPAIHPNGGEFTLENSFRGGDLVTNVTGVLDFAFSKWRIQPTDGADYTPVNERPEVPEVGGDFTVASFNVLNYFTTLGDRGARTQEEFDRQEAKIVAALAEIDADVFGLIEIENNDDVAVAALVEALNEVVDDDYEYIRTGVIGTDVITTALIYKPSAVTPTGDFAILDSSVDPRFDDDHNRPALAQAFTDTESGATIAVVVNHLKSKGSACAGDPDLGNGAGNCNLTRKAAVEAMVDWLADEPTAAEAGYELVIGDMNSYDKEDPIDVFVGAGYTDLLLRDQGEHAYSYVFDGQIGYLDYALAGTALAPKVTKAADWRINADEPDILDYTMEFKQDAQDALFEPNPYRSSDHDPVIVGMDFIAPELEVTADPDLVFPPNAQWRTVTFDIEATDGSGQVDVTIVDTTAEGHKAEIDVVSDTEVRVLARQGAVYTVAFEASDPYGNTTTRVVTVRVGP